MSTIPGKNKKSVRIAGPGCHRRCGKHHRRTKWSRLGEFLQSFYEKFPSIVVNEVENLNAFSKFSLLRPFQGFDPRVTRTCPG